MAAVLAHEQNGVLAEGEKPGPPPRVSLGAGWRPGSHGPRGLLPPEPRHRVNRVAGLPRGPVGTRIRGGPWPDRVRPLCAPPCLRCRTLRAPQLWPPDRWPPLPPCPQRPHGHTKSGHRDGFQTLRDNDANFPVGLTACRVPFQKLPRRLAHSILRRAAPGGTTDPHFGDGTWCPQSRGGTGPPVDTRGQEDGAREGAQSGISCVFVRQSRPAAARGRGPCWAAPLHPGQAAPEGGTEEGLVT